ncbi:SGNH/GDSL hydrolase family protein [Effusibacillus dendaii]|uniref:SGNH hydrolase-type esterase domain-containing protein n=1 Tax=Effusibacillus dendaii TaxID=2743772 RepID=A0A7I8DBJ2_9BACL|nr:SGNH/GDSL hydrolase family protein [Effusibacillus dendaii]BCJ86712.1 hypothetical protein skT53_16970 [Effusibacillus dendaii]
MVFYTALGDSITVGKSATSPLYGYTERIASYLRHRNIPVSVLRLAHSGWTSHALLNAVVSNDPLPLQKATTISLWIGGNDLILHAIRSQRITPQTVRRAAATYEQNVHQLIVYIRKWSTAPIVICTQYNPFPNTPLAVEAVGILNEAIHLAAARHQLQIAPTDTWFSGNEPQLIAGYRTGRLEDLYRRIPFGPYPIHPNNQGHLLIAQNLLPYMQ